ncbi:hypothetical protein [Synechocystis sp. PCC 7339]|nr:hypothetical protein [Synechocystis sp. PCC 7339]
MLTATFSLSGIGWGQMHRCYLIFCLNVAIAGGQMCINAYVNL